MRMVRHLFIVRYTFSAVVLFISCSANAAMDSATTNGDESLALWRNVRWSSGLILLLMLLWWETFAPFFPQFREGFRSRLGHGVKNLALALINSAMTAALFAGLWAWASAWATQHQFGLLNLGSINFWLRAALALLLLDCWTYFWHRLNHRVPFLWRFHRTHHSDAQMDVTTASRFHFGEILFSNCLRIGVILAVGIRLWELVLYEIILLAVIQFHHANVGLPPRLDQWLRGLIVTPAMHKVHHSRLQPETDSNYSSILSIWDRLFRTFRLRPDPRTIQFGLDGYDNPKRQSLRGLLGTPIGKSDEGRR